MTDQAIARKSVPRVHIHEGLVRRMSSVLHPDFTRSYGHTGIHFEGC
jgi:hypothetical protein